MNAYKTINYFGLRINIKTDLLPLLNKHEAEKEKLFKVLKDTMVTNMQFGLYLKLFKYNSGEFIVEIEEMIPDLRQTRICQLDIFRI